MLFFFLKMVKVSEWEPREIAPHFSRLGNRRERMPVLRARVRTFWLFRLLRSFFRRRPVWGNSSSDRVDQKNARKKRPKKKPLS